MSACKGGASKQRDRGVYEHYRLHVSVIPHTYKWEGEANFIDHLANSSNAQ